MRSWIAKAAVQGAVSRLPQSHRLNGLLQRYVTRSLDLDEPRFLEKWEQAARHLRAWRQHGSRRRLPGTVVELGTGWYPIVPLGLALSGATQVLSFDVAPLLREDRVRRTLRVYEGLARRGALPDLQSDAADRIAQVLRRSAGKSAEWLLAAFGVQVRRADARDTRIADGSVDLFISNNTLEHIPRQELAEILAEFHRIGRPAAVMSHFIDMADHYAGFDPSINVLNFLQYSERQWELFNNALHYQNRLRLPDYRDLHRDADWAIADEDLDAAPAALLADLDLAPEFRGIDEGDLRVTGAWLTSRPIPRPRPAKAQRWLRPVADVAELARRIRVHAVRMTMRGRSSHVGSILSMADIMAVLYGRVLRVDPRAPKHPERDRFILSKGHAGAGVYAALAERGFFPRERLQTHCQDGSTLSGHVSHKEVPGVELSTGSLGHGLSVAAGMALAGKLDGADYRVFTVLSDGECDEGSVWEAAMFAAHHQLSNLVVIVDYNKLQSLATVEDTLRLEPFADKWRAFGWTVQEVDGHDHAALQAALQPGNVTGPTCIIAHTIKGKGVSFMENAVLWHYRSPQDDEYEAALEELADA